MYCIPKSENEMIKLFFYPHMDIAFDIILAIYSITVAIKLDKI